MSRTKTWLLMLALVGCGSNGDDGREGDDDKSATDDGNSSDGDEDDNDDDNNNDGGPGSGTPSGSGSVGEVCLRLDECGFLPPGFRRADCEDTTAACLEGQLQSEVSDWELVANECLEFQNCFNFLDCYAQVTSCEVALESDTTGEGPLTTFDGSTGIDGDESTGGFGTSGGALETGDESDSNPTSASAGMSDTTDPTGQPPVCDGPCNTCVDCAFEGPCFAETQDCLANSDCLSLNDCVLDCEADAFDIGFCIETCEVIWSDGITDHDALFECTTAECLAC